ncbi:MAG: hypothetical protein HC904_08010 [Blastochloris sp.]|nr:hypothetical protein [Blastochloris sp.]
MSKSEILGYILVFKGAGLIGGMATFLGLAMFEFLQPLYWCLLSLGVAMMLGGLALAAATEKVSD